MKAGTTSAGRARVDSSTSCLGRLQRCVTAHPKPRSAPGKGTATQWPERRPSWTNRLNNIENQCKSQRRRVAALQSLDKSLGSGSTIRRSKSRRRVPAVTPRRSVQPWLVLTHRRPCAPNGRGLLLRHDARRTVRELACYRPEMPRTGPRAELSGADARSLDACAKTNHAGHNEVENQTQYGVDVFSHLFLFKSSTSA